MLTKYDNNKQKRIWYYTDDITKFNNDIANKEHQIEGLGAIGDNWLQEVRINNKGDIVPSKIINHPNYKNSYCWNYTNTDIYATFVGGKASNDNHCGLLYLSSHSGVNGAGSDNGFVKVTILDD